MFDAWVVWALIGGILLLVGVLYVVSAPAGRKVLEDRALRTARSAKVGEVMSHPVLTARPDMTLEQAATMMLDRGVGCLPVVGEDGKLAGIVTETDLTGRRMALGLSTVGRALQEAEDEETYDAARSTPIREVMRRHVITATEDEPITDAAMKLIDENVHHLPVVRDGVPVGVIARRDVLGLLGSKRPEPRSRPG